MIKQKLNGSWTFASRDEATWLPATVPGCVHTDLLRAEQIPDPFYGDNELDVMWVGETDWVYRRTFVVEADLLAHEHLQLRCHGLDTLATIVINDTVVAQTDNAFRQYEFDVKSLLQAGENEIEIIFASAVQYGRSRLEERYIHNWGAGSDKVPGGNYLRKSQCNFGWDWGPRLVTCGIWRDIELVAYGAVHFQDIHILQAHQGGDVALNCYITLENSRSQSVAIQLTIALNGQEVAAQTIQTKGEVVASELSIPDPQLWWPNGLGAQPLYVVHIDLLDESGQAIDALQKRIGLRTLELDRHPDEWGESFQFVVNGVPFFAKGANWIPADAFITRISDAQYQQLLKDTAVANMNMLRVWGGGIYEQDIFYDLCDELGICVWQDFMFACATYPTFEDTFMENVKAEAIDNIQRLRHHACLALWCGNNEMEQGLVDDTWTETAMSWGDYQALFDKLLADLVAKHDPQTAYWPASPHTPHGDRRDHNNPQYGDAHLWSVWHGKEPFEWYRTCEHRFNSEFGFQSFPEPQTVRTFTVPEDRNITSFVMEHHQRSGIGNQTIMHYMLDWFLMPTSFADTLWLSQITQGMAMTYAVEHWRRSMPRGMGTLVWQLNDCWPVASWSSIDYFGRWKALHYMSRRFNAPLLISGVEDWEAGTAEIHLTNDKREDVTGMVRWHLTQTDGALRTQGEFGATAVSGQSNHLTTLELADELTHIGKRNSLLWVAFVVDDTVVSQNLVLFARPKHLFLQDPQLAYEVVRLGNGRFQVTLTAQKPSLWTWLTLTEIDARYSDNFFHLQANERKTIIISTAPHIQLEEVKAQLNIQSLNTMQQIG